MLRDKLLQRPCRLRQSPRMAKHRLVQRFEPARPLDKGIPPTLENAIAVAMYEHPSIQAALHGVDVATLQVKIARDW